MQVNKNQLTSIPYNQKKKKIYRFSGKVSYFWMTILLASLCYEKMVDRDFILMLVFFVIYSFCTALGMLYHLLNLHLLVKIMCWLNFIVFYLFISGGLMIILHQCIFVLLLKNWESLSLTMVLCH